MAFDKILRKHVAAIHIYAEMSVLQRKIANVLLYEALNENRQKSSGLVTVECCMSLSDLAKAIKFNSHNYQYLKEAVDGLASLKISWNVLKDKAPSDISFLNLRILHGSPTFYKDGSLNFSFHKVMLDLVGNPEIYGSIDLDTQALFGSKYSHALYENSTRAVNLQKVKFIELSVFKGLLSVNDASYGEAKALIRKIINPSIEEVNDLANFEVKVEYVKTGRKITGVELIATKKHTKNERVVYEEVGDKSNISAVIFTEFGAVSDSVVDNIIKNYSEEYILEKIEYTKNKTKKESTGFYPAAYFISALKHDYKSSGIKNTPVVEKTVEHPEKERSWEEGWSELKRRDAHWQKMLELAKKNNNLKHIDEMETAIAECERKLKQHILDMPKFSTDKSSE